MDTDTPQGLAEDLSRLTPDALRVVTRWAEDRLCNAVTPLSVRLQMEMPGTLAADVTLQAAARAIERVMAAVEEVRNLLHEAPQGNELYRNARPSSVKRSKEKGLDSGADHG